LLIRLTAGLLGYAGPILVGRVWLDAPQARTSARRRRGGLIWVEAVAERW
jgi:hypothetical protein